MSTTWQVSYHRIQEKNQAAAELLKFWAYLDNRNLEHTMIQDSKAGLEAPPRLAAMVTSETDFRDAVADLMETSFLTSSGRDKWSLHNVLHRWTHTTLNTTLDEEFSRWAVICIGSKAEKRGTTSY